MLADDRGDYPPIEIPVVLGEPAVLFEDDLEIDLEDWVLDGWGVDDDGVSALLSDSPNRRYQDDDDETAEIARSFDLSATGGAWLTFNHFLYIDNDFDAALVEVSTNEGDSWAAVEGRDSDAGSGVGVQSDGEPVYDGRIFEREPEIVDLSAYAGEPDVRVRLHFLSDGIHRVDGWLVDDVRILAYPAETPRSPLDPEPLLVGARDDDVVLDWRAVDADPTHDAPDGYELYRSDSVRGDGGFLRHDAVLSERSVDEGAHAEPGSFAYLVVASNCAGGLERPALGGKGDIPLFPELVSWR